MTQKDEGIDWSSLLGILQKLIKLLGKSFSPDFIRRYKGEKRGKKKTQEFKDSKKKKKKDLIFFFFIK